MSLLWISSHTRKVWHPFSFSVLRHAPIDQHCCTVGGWAHRRLSSSRFYWRLDLEEMGKKLAELEADIDRGISGAQEKLESFREQRKLLVDSILQAGFHFVVSIPSSAHNS